MNRTIILVVFCLIGCGPQELSSEGEGDVLDEDELGSTAEVLGSRPVMRMPFHCGQVWTASTWRGHSPEQAIDWNRLNDLGDAVVASANGHVTRSESEGNTSYGNWIEVEHAGGYRTRYAHLRVRLARVGDHVQMGEKIGEVGETGGADGVHLHYEQLAGQTPVRVILGTGTHVQYFEKRDYRSGNSCN